MCVLTTAASTWPFARNHAYMRTCALYTSSAAAERGHTGRYSTLYKDGARPLASHSTPAHAIMTPLSVHHVGGGRASRSDRAAHRAPSLHMQVVFVWPVSARPLLAALLNR